MQPRHPSLAAPFLHLFCGGRQNSRNRLDLRDKNAILRSHFRGIRAERVFARIGGVEIGGRGEALKKNHQTPHRFGEDGERSETDGVREIIAKPF